MVMLRDLHRPASQASLQTATVGECEKEVDQWETM